MEWAENEFQEQLTPSEKAELANIIKQEHNILERKRSAPKENINAKKKTNGHSGQLIKNGPPARDGIVIQAGFSGHLEMDRVTTVSKNGDERPHRKINVGPARTKRSARK